MALKTIFKHQFFDDNGDPLNGGKVYFYEAGTSTAKDTYTTSAGTVANANPVILNSRGEADIWTDGLYKVDVKTSADVQVTGYPVDNVGAGSSNNDANMRWCGTSTGSANVQVLSPTTSITAYAIGQSFVFKAGYTNSSTATIAVSGLAALAVQANFAALGGGEIVSGQLYVIVLDTLTTAQVSLHNVSVMDRIAEVTSHATTAAIWADGKETINWNGTATTTAFPAAPHAGARRTLRCSSTPSFTAGANMIIGGVASGKTVTLAGNDEVDVLAYTTTQFILKIRSDSKYIGYPAGTGGEVSQITSKSTGVTLSELTGVINSDNAALAASTSVSFILTNTLLANTDILLVNLGGSGYTTGAYQVTSQSATGFANITIRNVTAGSLSESVVINFAIFRSRDS